MSGRDGSRDRISYLVGGLRISLAALSNTPGPRTHVLGVVNAWREHDYEVDLDVVSEYPLLGRFARLRTSDFSSARTGKLLLADLVRCGAAVWSGAITFVRSMRRPRPDFIYERAAVLQSLTSFHRYKSRAVRVIEANGILSREAARDRNGLKLERLAAAVERRVFRRADLIVAVSEPLKREIRSFAGVPEDKVIVVRNATETSLALKQRPKDETALIIGFLGSLATWQNLPGIVEQLAAHWEAIQQVANGREVRFHIVGDGADREAIRRAVTESGMEDRVSLLGLLSRDEALDECARWAVGLAAHQKSTSDTMYHSPLKLYEYAALGLVLLCTPSGDAEALKADGIPTVIYPSRDGFSEALVDAVQVAASRTEDDISASRQIVRERHTWERRAVEITEAVDVVAERGKRGAR